jgi:hypothetical protein
MEPRGNQASNSTSSHALLSRWIGRVLAHFRKSLSAAMLKKLEASINKDLTKTPDKELSSHLPMLFARQASAF